MKTAFAVDGFPTRGGADQQAKPVSVQFQVVEADRGDPLSKCVEEALRIYLGTTGRHEVTDLHRLVIQEVERPLFETVLKHVDGNLSNAARILGLTRNTLRKRLTDYGIDRGR
ncbi:MAG: Fis family transcriptional regulator [Chromatiaceae bacterium]|nr:Fis family transcriptional regulator [Chromatiaceae bacterium]